MASWAEGAVGDIAGQTSRVDRCPAPEASPVLQPEGGDISTRFGPNRVAADMGETEDLIFW